MTSTISSRTDFDEIYLAFDIRDVLGERKAYADKTLAPLFQTYGMEFQVPIGLYPEPASHHVYSEPGSYYVYPFVKELFQLLAKTKGVGFGFFPDADEITGFTFGDKISVRSCVKQLLIHSLGEETFCKIADEVRISTRRSWKEISKMYWKKSEYFINLVPDKSLKSLYNRDSDGGFLPKIQQIHIKDSKYETFQDENVLHISGRHWTETSAAMSTDHILRDMVRFFSSYEEFKESQKDTKYVEFLALVPKKRLNKEETLLTFVVIYHDREGEKELELGPEESRKIQELYEKSVQESILFFERHCMSVCCFNEINDEFRKADLSSLEEVYTYGEGHFPVLEEIYIYGEGCRPKDCVKEAKNGYAAIHLRGDDANIYLPGNPQEAISLKKHGFLKLLEESRKYWESQKNYFWKKKNYFWREKDKKTAGEQLYDIVWNKVKNLVMKDMINHKGNHILLLTGAIFKAWEESKATQKPVGEILFNWQSEEKEWEEEEESEILFNWQFKEEKGGKQFKPSLLQKRTDLYLKGLEMLRQVNPQLEPITIESFADAQEKYPHLSDDEWPELLSSDRHRGMRTTYKYRSCLY